jgi:hypothetical protein
MLTGTRPSPTHPDPIHDLEHVQDASWQMQQQAKHSQYLVTGIRVEESSRK